MGRNCAISNCPDRKGKPSHKVHSFPNAKHALLRSIWISQAIGTPSSLKLDNFGVCSRHFSSNNYVAGHATTTKSKGGEDDVQTNGDEEFEIPPDPAEANLELINSILNTYEQV
ncbi:hypothetical protein Fcan01_06501 [Folsomia candida]|uniref:THAP-type domain-containing protein n=1 Tax=Folsomia candida TaxID=158441 RepID=A0A226EJK9_FOLCA|nr:hypothetical protein Fcan01_06501 [Folsomia candida]